VAGLIVIVPIALAACSSAADGQALAQQACVHVHRSVHYWVASLETGTPTATSADLQRKAEQELHFALPLAAAANSDDGSWNSLMTVISEIATVDEGHLLPSLKAQCAVADAQTNVNPQNPQNPQSPANTGGSPGSGSVPGATHSTPPTGNVNPKGASG
jgi:hypothetical protein